MGEQTKIEWCDHTFNPWRGCTKVAAGCEHCYADTLSKRNPSVLGIWGPHGTRVKAAEAHWKLPIKWNEWAARGVCAKCGGKGCAAKSRLFCWQCRGTGLVEPYRGKVFCASLADVFEDWDGPIQNAKGEQLFRHAKDPLEQEFACVPGGRLFTDPHKSLRQTTLNDLRRELFALIDATPNLDWLLLTKRPENIRKLWPPYVSEVMPRDHHRHNVWLVTSIAAQEDADRNVPELLKCSDLSPVLGLSAEPIVGPIDLTYPPSLFPDGPQMCCSGHECGCQGLPCDPPPWFYPPEQSINWVIIGGESGPGARPCNLAWIRSLVEQCKAASVPCFVKQLGAEPVTYDMKYGTDFGDGSRVSVIYQHDKKGGDWSEWPDDLRVRQFPQTEAAV